MSWKGADFQHEWAQSKIKHDSRVRSDFMREVGEQLDRALAALREGRSFFSNPILIQGMSCSMRADLIREIANVNPTARKLLISDQYNCSRVDVKISVQSKQFD